MPPGIDYEALWTRLDAKFADLYDKLEENARCIREQCSERKERCDHRFFDVEASIRDKTTERKSPPGVCPGTAGLGKVGYSRGVVGARRFSIGYHRHDLDRQDSDMGERIKGGGLCRNFRRHRSRG